MMVGGGCAVPAGAAAALVQGGALTGGEPGPHAVAGGGGLLCHDGAKAGDAHGAAGANAPCLGVGGGDLLCAGVVTRHPQVRVGSGAGGPFVQAGEDDGAAHIGTSWVVCGASAHCSARRPVVVIMWQPPDRAAAC